MQKLARILRGIDAISYWSGYGVMFLALGIVTIMIVEVIARYVFNDPTLWATETLMLAFGIYMLLAGAYVLLVRGHVMMDAVYSRFSLRTRATLDVLTFVFFFLFVGIMLWQGIPYAVKCVVMGEHSQSAWRCPFWPARIAIPIGAFLLLLQGLAKLARDFHVALTGRELA